MKISNRYFTLIDSDITHNQLLFRGVQSQKYLKNFDLLFEGVQFLKCPFSFKDFEISVSQDESIVEENYQLEQQDKVFVIHTKEGAYYIVAHRLLYQENEYEPQETSIPSKRSIPLTEAQIFELAKAVESEEQLLPSKVPSNWEVFD